MTVTIENVIPDGEFTINELTEISLDGNGVFDALLRTFTLHLNEQFRLNRITGTAFASTYAQVYPTLLQNAIQYTLAKSKLAPELEKIELENKILVTQNEQLRAEINKIATDTAVSVKQGHLVDAQTCLTQAQTNQVNAEVSLKLPVEVANLEKQGILITAQTSEVNYQVSDLLPAQKDQIIQQTLKTTADTAGVIHQTKLTDANICNVEASTARTNLETTLKLPEEVNLLKKQAIQTTGQADLLVAQRLNTLKDIEKTSAEMLNIPKQGELIDAQITKMEKDSELALVQIGLAEKDLELKDKNLILLDKQVASQEAQNNLYNQKVITERAQTDPSVIRANSVIDRQNKMMQAQADGFKRDAEQKAAKIMVDTWSLRKNTDPEGNPENNINKLEDVNIGLTLQKMLQGVDINI